MPAHRIRAMNSHAIRQNADSWSGLFAEHLETVKKRSSSPPSDPPATTHCWCTAGTPPLLFLDDHHRPFRVQAPFKVWAPLTDAPDSFVFFTPGKKPQLLIHQPVDYWHKSPALPNTYWSGAFDIVSLRRPHRGPQPRCPGICRAPRSSALPFQNCSAGVPGAINPEHLHRAARLRPARRRHLTKLPACARRTCSGHAATVAAERAFRAGASEFGIALAFMAACGQRETPAALQPHRRARMKVAPCCTTRSSSAQGRRRLHSLLIDAGAAFGGYASDITRTHSHHAADFAAARQDVSTRSSSDSVRRCAWASTGGSSPGLLSGDHARFSSNRRDHGDRGRSRSTPR